MSDTNDLEEGKIQQLDFDKVWEIGRSGHRVIPVVLQDADTGEVLFVAYTNDEAFRMTLQLRTAVLYS
ncbi:MAG: phosphoribosyl-AMP cyclohydrolase, partial [Actinomycetota bacterium]|nr:phosphoribosyl-AMP cyclohydrolase [Actinomycetota bacterium]MEC9339213.1 phosphoribosyl-AMP cyclohydrolase [Actinomycetota bacterium]